MATHSIGKIFVELDLDPSRYMKSQQTILKEAKNGATILEKNYKNLGIKSGALYDLQRQQAKKAYESIVKSGKATADDIIRAEKAKNTKIKALNNEQRGHTTSMLTTMKKNWMAYSAAGVAAIYAIRKVFRGAGSLVEAAGEFESALNDMSKVTDRSLGEIRAEIMLLPSALGSATELVRGSYQVMSAGVTDVKESLDTLITSSQLAKTAHSDQARIVGGLTSVMDAFNVSAGTSADTMQTMEKIGKTTVAGMIPIIGEISASSAALGISIDEM